MRTATSHDVARVAGVSQSTVSRALRDDPSISAATRQHVRAVATSLGYVPIDRGRSLSTRQTQRVGIVSAELTNPFYPELVEPLRGSLERHGYRALLIPEGGDSEQALQSLSDGSLDGVVMTTAALGARLPHLLHRRGVPVVLVNRQLDGTGLDTCVMDNANGARAVADLLAGLGHRSIAMITGPATTSTSRDREAGFLAGLAEHGLALPTARIRRGEFSYQAGRAAAVDLLDGPDRPTAIFCLNDVIALGACNAAAARGLTPGRDLTLVGFDDIAMADWDVFSLTTVRCDLPAMAGAAVSLLLKRVRDPDREPERLVLTAELVLRATHGAPR